MRVMNDNDFQDFLAVALGHRLECGGRITDAIEWALEEYDGLCLSPGQWDAAHLVVGGSAVDPRERV